MTGLIIKVSGVALLEKTLVAQKPQYKEYIEKTSAFIPVVFQKSNPSSDKPYEHICKEMGPSTYNSLIVAIMLNFSNKSPSKI